MERIASLARAKGVPVHSVSFIELSRILGGDRHRGVLLQIDDEIPSPRGVLKTFLKNLESQQSLVVILDGITDPHNLGAILRTADQFAVDLVILPSHKAARETDTVASISSGASAWVPVSIETNLCNAMTLMKKEGFWIYGADLQGSLVTQVELSGRVGLVIGSEGGGIRQLVRKMCDGLIRIPSSGHVDSFNASVAAGILMYEARRQQGFT